MRVAVCCSQNHERSIAVHEYFLRENYTQIQSFGTSKQIKISGETTEKVYTYKSSYRNIYDDLKGREEIYKRNGVLEMLERNMKIKKGPEYLFEHAVLLNPNDKRNVDLVIALERSSFEKVFEAFGKSGCGDDSAILIRMDTVSETELPRRVFEFVQTVKSEYEKETSLTSAVDAGMKSKWTDGMVAVPARIKLL